MRLLDALGFPWETTSFEKWELRDVPAMEWFKKKHGHLAVPTTFTLPAGAEAAASGLPRIAAGTRFGLRCVQIRKRLNAGVLDARVERKLETLGFPASLQEAFLRRVVFPAVTPLSRSTATCAGTRGGKPACTRCPPGRAKCRASGHRGCVWGRCSSGPCGPARRRSRGA